MHEVRVPKLNNNDDTYVLLEWLADDGAAVGVDDPIVLIETSKAVEEIVATVDGTIRRLRVESADCAPGDVVATIATIAADADADAADERASAISPATRGQDAPAPATPELSRAAAEFAARHDISAATVAGLGRRVVRVRDLEKIVADRATASTAVSATSTTTSTNGRTGRRAQAGVARTVDAAAQIPAAYSLAHLDADAFVAVTRELAAASRPAPSALDVVLKIVAGLYDRHPALYVDPDPEIGDDAIGVTVDAGHGLFVPVVHDAGRRPLAEIGAVLTAHARAARGSGFIARQLRGARISISVTAYAGIAFTVPLIHPGQVAMLSLGMVTTRVKLDGGAVREVAVLPLGISYDHRAVNGRDAVVFLRAIAARFGDRDWLVEATADRPTIPAIPATGSRQT